MHLPLRRVLIPLLLAAGAPFLGSAQSHSGKPRQQGADISASSKAQVANSDSGPKDRAENIPHLEKRGVTTQVVVDGRPFLLFAGELHNSSSSSLEYMKPIWPRIAAMHLNSVVLPVAWESIEPEEGRYDFTLVDGLLQGARENNLHLVILWFGSWKNTYSSYIPGWVKQDTKRFPRVQTSDGRDTERLSPFSSANRDADARAFARLLQHLREADREQHTVLLVQVENEVGVIPESRDHSPAADQAFAAPVPGRLTRYLAEHRSQLEPTLRAAWEAAGAKTTGNWEDVFGRAPLTDDLFMAWYFATYVDHVAAAGKAMYPLLMYANAALIRPNYAPGQYNSGGPLPHSMDIWKAGAPSLDFLSPDIYFNEFAYWAAAYSRSDNPLFIPEAQGGATGAANALYAFGQLKAIGFSPFGIDDESNTPIDLVGITHPGEQMDSRAIAACYKVLAGVEPLLLQKQAEGKVGSMLIEGDAQRGARLGIGEYMANMTRPGGPGAGGAPSARASALFMQTGVNEFLVIGSGDAQITFSAVTPGPPIVSIESIDEGTFENGAFVPGRRLNGDESNQGQALRLHATDLSQNKVYRVRLYRYR